MPTLIPCTTIEATVPIEATRWQSEIWYLGASAKILVMKKPNQTQESSTHIVIKRNGCWAPRTWLWWSLAYHPKATRRLSTCITRSVFLLSHSICEKWRVDIWRKWALGLETAQWARALAVQAEGPGFETTAPTSNASHDRTPRTPPLGGWRQAGPVWNSWLPVPWKTMSLGNKVECVLLWIPDMHSWVHTPTHSLSPYTHTTHTFWKAEMKVSKCWKK